MWLMPISTHTTEMTVRKNERKCEKITELSRTETNASLLHNAPLRETQFSEDFFLNFQPANRVVSGSRKPKTRELYQF